MRYCQNGTFVLHHPCLRMNVVTSLEEAHIRRCKDDRYIVIAAYLSSTISQRRMASDSSFAFITTIM